MRQIHGFTLLELMATVAIVALLTALAVTGYSRLVEGARLATAANTIKGDLEAAKLTAVKRHVPVAVSFTAGSGANGTYTLFVDDGATVSSFDAGEEVILTRSMPTNITLGSIAFGGGTTVRFNTIGLPGTTSGSTRLANSSNTRFRRISLAAAGSITMQRSSNGTTWEN